MDQPKPGDGSVRSTGRETLESGLDEEIRFHIDQQTEKHRQAGMSPAEARRLARLKFGGMEGVKETTRDEFRLGASRGLGS